MHFRRLGYLVTTVLLVSQIAVPAANADQLTPTNDPPTVANLQLPSAIQPASPRSVSIYTVTATVGSQGTVANLKSVTMCWYKGSASSTCADAATHPETQFEMTWTQATNSFAITGTNHYRNAGSNSDYGDGSGLSMDVSFKFKVSEAMLMGSDWNVAVRAVDQQDQGTVADPVFSTELVASGLVVLFFGSVATQPASQDFGALKYNEEQTLNGISTGAFHANGAADITLAASDFTYGSSTIYLDSANPSPSSGSVAMWCSIGSSYDSVTAIRVGTAASTFITSEFSSGTGESTGSTQDHSCRLSFGGGAAVANVQYSNTVTIGIGQSF